jgi:hypothetical protein
MSYKPSPGAASEPRSVHTEHPASADPTNPANGQAPDFIDEGEALGVTDAEVQQGGDRTLREAHRDRPEQGPKTVRANRKVLKGGRSD